MTIYNFPEDKQFKKRIKDIMRHIDTLEEEELRRISTNPRQFIEEVRPYIEGLRELVDEMRVGNVINFRYIPDDVCPPLQPVSINVPVQDYERWKRMESTVQRLTARLGL